MRYEFAMQVYAEGGIICHEFTLRNADISRSIHTVQNNVLYLEYIIDKIIISPFLFKVKAHLLLLSCPHHEFFPGTRDPSSVEHCHFLMTPFRTACP